jgi:hypothetical protein
VCVRIIFIVHFDLSFLILISHFSPVPESGYWLSVVELNDPTSGDVMVASFVQYSHHSQNLNTNFGTIFVQLTVLLTPRIDAMGFERLRFQWIQVERIPVRSMPIQ